MKFDKKYPNAKLFEEPQPSIVKGGEEYSCWNCGDPTVWYELDFLASLCSEECVSQKEAEYMKAALETGPTPFERAVEDVIDTNCENCGDRTLAREMEVTDDGAWLCPKCWDNLEGPFLP